MSAPPWENVDSDLARAFEKALSRIQAVTETDENGNRDPISLMTPDVHALLFSGLDVDTGELVEYLSTIASNYMRLIDERGTEIVTAALKREEAREVYLPRVKAAAHLLLRGMAGTCTLAGALYGVELERKTGVGKPLSPSGRGIGHVLMEKPVDEGRIPVGRVPTIAERNELSRDAVQAVLDLEADRLERTATTIGFLGIERAANLMQAAAMIIRYELSGGADPIPPALARQHQGQRERLDRDQVAQLNMFRGMSPDTQQRYLAALEEMELRHEEERRGEEL